MNHETIIPSTLHGVARKIIEFAKKDTIFTQGDPGTPGNPLSERYSIKKCSLLNKHSIVSFAIVSAWVGCGRLYVKNLLGLVGSPSWSVNHPAHAIWW
jgi:hypothetical protein